MFIINRKETWVNTAIIVANIFCFLYLEVVGSSENFVFMKQHGAMYAPAVVGNHEYYRLVTSVFMHFGINHIANNMLVLFLLGDKMERTLGSIKYLIFYLLCGVGANIVSLLAGMDDKTVGAGASGAIFGVIGGLLYAAAVNKGRLEGLSTRQLVVTIAVSLYFGFTSSGVDNVAHVAGLIIGIALAVIFYRKPKRKSSLK